MVTFMNDIHATALHEIHDENGKLQFSCKVKQMSKGYSDKMLHNHEELKIVRIMNGSCVWNINGTDLACERGDILLMNRLDIRYIRAITSNEPLVTYQFCFYPVALIPNVGSAHFFYCRPDGFSNRFSKSEKTNLKLSPIFDEICDEINNNEAYRDEIILNLLSNMILHLSRFFKQTENTSQKALSQSTLIQNTLTFIKENLDSDLSLSAIASHMNVSPAYFSRIFKQYCGIGLREYIMRSRVIRFIALLQSSPTANIIDLAFCCGFNTSSGFYRAFKKVTGTTPKSFLTWTEKQ